MSGQTYILGTVDICITMQSTLSLDFAGLQHERTVWIDTDLEVSLCTVVKLNMCHVTSEYLQKKTPHLT